MAAPIQPQLAAHEHQRTEADVKPASNSVVCMNYCVIYMNFSAQQSSARVA